MDGMGTGPILRGAAITIAALRKSYGGGVMAVDGVSIDVKAGEFLALLGPSGSGKTTILMSIAGFETPSSGDIRIGERVITHVPPNKRDVGMVFQSYALFPHMSVAENVAFPLQMRRVSKTEIATRVEAALALVRLTGYGARRPAQLSGGQQQRVAIARALVFGPSVLLMDEPLGALDRKLREEMQLEIKRLHKRLGVTIVYVTHDQDEALMMADRIAVLHNGKLEQIGAPDALYERPASAFVADFFGKTNFLNGTMTPEGVALDGGGILPVDEALQPGTKVRAAVRPERIIVATDASGLGGTISEIIYAGSAIVAIVVLANGQLVTAKIPNTAGQQRWREGDTVAVRINAADVRLYPA